MSILTDLYTYLSTYSALTALVAIRIYPVDSVPQNCKLPYVTYGRTSNPAIHLMTADAALYSPTVEINIFAATVSSLLAIEAVVVTALRDYTGIMGSTTIQRSFYEDSYYGGFDSDINTYQQTVEFTIWHE